MSLPATTESFVSKPSTGKQFLIPLRYNGAADLLDDTYVIFGISSEASSTTDKDLHRRRLGHPHLARITTYRLRPVSFGMFPHGASDVIGVLEAMKMSMSKTTGA